MTAASRKTYAEQFEDACPYYLAIGMSFSDYWDGDCALVRYYRRADELREKRRNQELWLQGLYVHEAVSVALGNAFRKKGTRPQPYSDKPYPVTVLERREQDERQYQERRARMRGRMERIMTAINAKFDRQKEANGNGNHR